MADFDNLIEYLRLGRRAEEANDHQLAQENVVLNYLEGGEAFTTTREDLMSDVVMYRRLSFAIIENDAQDIYLWHTGTSHKYYIKTTAGTYLNLYNNAIETPPEENLQEFHLELGPEDYFYYAEEGRVVIATQELNEIVLFNDVIDFDPEAGYLEDIRSKKYDYKFRTHMGIFSNDGTAERPNLDFDEVSVFKNTVKAEINLIPIMEANAAFGYKLWYLYKLPNPRPSSFMIREKDCAIRLEFGSIGGFLAFLNATLFSQGFNLSITGDNMIRDTFRDSFENDILEGLKDMLDSGAALYYMDAMELLYYLPPSVADNIGLDTWWKLANALIKKGDIKTSAKLKEEFIFIKLLEMLLEGENPEENKRWQKEFIKVLTSQTDKKQLALEYLYGELDGQNYEKFLQMVNKAWRVSLFTDPDNILFENSIGPFILPYESEKMIGFFLTNTKAYFDTNNQKERMIHVEFETGKYVIDHSNNPKEAEGKMEKEIVDDYWYHPFHPVFLKNIEGQETEIKLDAIVPAFMLKANHDARFWHNVMTGAEYAFDIATTISGVGNIAKLRYLSRLIKIAESVEALDKTRKAYIILRAAKGVSAAISITFGTTSALLKLTGLRDTELGSAIWEFLFWLELGTLAGDLTASMAIGIRKNAGEILAHEEALRKTAKTVEEAAEIERVISELDELAIQEAKQILDELGGVVIGENLLKKYIKDAIEKCRRAGLKLEVKMIDKAHPEFYNTGLKGRLRVFADSMTKVLLEIRPQCSKLTWQHEMWHLDDFIEMGWKRYTEISRKTPWLHEQAVWERILANRYRWNEKELVDSYLYYKKYCIEKNALYSINKDLEILSIKYQPKKY